MPSICRPSSVFLSGKWKTYLNDTESRFRPALFLYSLLFFCSLSGHQAREPHDGGGASNAHAHQNGQQNNQPRRHLLTDR